MKCFKCKYRTCCLRTMMQHSSDCLLKNFQEPATFNLDKEMHCICGFYSSDGNKLARHLTACGHSTVYPTVEDARENTVTQNVLKALELVPHNNNNEIFEITDSDDDVADETMDTTHLSPDDFKRQTDRDEVNVAIVEHVFFICFH